MVLKELLLSSGGFYSARFCICLLRRKPTAVKNTSENLGESFDEKSLVFCRARVISKTRYTDFENRIARIMPDQAYL